MEDYIVHTVWIGLGTNLGNRKENLSLACARLNNEGCKLLASSSIYESAPWGYESVHAFYNQCIVVESDLGPEALLQVLKKIESDMGRRFTNQGYQDRVIDLDILFYDNIQMNSPDLIIPHPEIPKRNFVLIPLMEIAPHKQHPLLRKSIENLAGSCDDKSEVRILTGK